MNVFSQAKWLQTLVVVFAASPCVTASAADESDIFQQIAKLRPPYSGDAAPNDQFGRSVDVSGDLMIVGVPDDDDVQNPNSESLTNSDSGSVVILQRDNNDPALWTRVAKLLPDDRNEGFGFDVAIVRCRH
jgi:hypothetical protein